MEKISHLKSLHVLVLVLGCLSIISYFLHVILGSINYPGYDFMSQAVSDLTADDSPSKDIARLFSSFYGFFSSLVSIGLIYIYRNEKLKSLKTGIYMLSMMYIISAIGYGLFPLSEDSFQITMHIIVTVIVVLLTISSLITLMISFIKMDAKKYFYVTLIMFMFLMGGAISTNLVSPNYFGLVERFSVFSVVIYIGVISYFNYDYKRQNIELKI